MTRIRERLAHVFTATEESSSRLARFIAFQLSLWRWCARRLREHDVMGMSAALCYRTIFTLIPILVLGLLVAKALGTLEDSQRSLRSFLEASGFAQIAAFEGPDMATPADAEATPAPSSSAAATMPARRIINVADEIERVVAQVEDKLTFARVGPVGGVLLVWTAVGLLTSLERSLNRIFGATRSRSVARRLLLYWSAVTLGPVTLVAASYLGRRAIDVFGQAPGVARLLVAAGWLGPMLAGVLVLAALYKLLPNTMVRWRSAIGGAAVAMVLWLLAKWGFALYVQHLVLKGNLYGVLGVLPLFLLWLYYSWLILLFGAELAHTAVNLQEMRRIDLAERTVLGPSDVLATAVAVAQPYEAGCGPVALHQIAARLRLPATNVQTLLDRLVSAGFICAAGNSAAPRYLPARPAEQIPLLALLDLADPRAVDGTRAGYEADLGATVARVQSRCRAAASGATLRDALGAGPDAALGSQHPLHTSAPAPHA